MSERIFEVNGLYVTSVAAPGGTGPVLEFSQDTWPDNPRLNPEQADALLVAIGLWIGRCRPDILEKREKRKAGLDNPNR